MIDDSSINDIEELIGLATKLMGYECDGEKVNEYNEIIDNAKRAVKQIKFEM